MPANQEASVVFKGESLKAHKSANISFQGE